jgi:hypothetical protein
MVENIPLTIQYNPNAEGSANNMKNVITGIT